MIFCSDLCRIALYEVKMLFRSRMFMLFFFLAVVCIPVGQYFIQGRLSVWHQVALSCALPFVNALLFVFYQSLVVIFLVNDLVADERRMDTLQALRAKAYSNGDYVIGKCCALVGVVLLMGIGAAVPVCCFQAFSDLSFDGWNYLFYWFTLTLPSVVFMTGLSFWVCLTVRLPFMALLILTGFWLADVVWLSDWQAGTADFMATKVPNAFSPAWGHVGLGNYLMHRVWVLLIGLGWIFYSVVSTRREDDTPRWERGWKLAGGMMVMAGIILVVGYGNQFRRTENIRHHYREQCRRYKGEQTVTVLAHSIDWQQEGKRMKVRDTLTVENPDSQQRDSIWFSLNPGLRVSAVEGDRQPLFFRQEGMIVKIAISMESGERCKIVICYSGEIDERAAYLSTPDSLLQITSWSNSLLSLGKRIACVSDRYTFLTPECLWYPVSHVPFHSDGPLFSERDFSRFRLTVHHRPDLRAVSQGRTTATNEGTIFTNKVRLPGLSLCIGAYEHRSLGVDGVRWEVCFFHRGGVFGSAVEGSPAGLTEGIRQVTGRLKEQYGCDYPYDKMVLVETPVSLCTYPDGESGGSGFVQPELLFVPENWCKSPSVTSIKGYVSEQIRLYPQFSDTLLEAGCIDALYLRNFRETRDEFPPMSFTDHLLGRQWALHTVTNPLSLERIYTAYMGRVHSDRFPGVNSMVNRMLTDQQSLQMTAGAVGPPAGMQAIDYLSSHSLREAIADPAIRTSLPDILLMKGQYFRQYLSALGNGKYDSFLSEWRKKHLFRVTDFREFAAEASRYFRIDVGELVERLYENRGLPMLFVDRIQPYTRGDTCYLLFDVRNLSGTEGVLSCYALGRDCYERQSFIIAAGEYRRICLPWNDRSENVLIHTNLSANLPAVYDYTFSEDPSLPESVPAGPSREEIIVDNEDSGFSISQTKAGRLWGNKLQSKQYGTSIDFIKGEFQGWMASLYTHAWGGRIRSFYGKRVGNGESYASWTTELPEDGEYEIFVYQLGLQPRFQQKDSVVYHYAFRQEEQIAEIRVLTGRDSRERLVFLREESGYEDEFIYRMRHREADWIPVGKYLLKKGEVKFILYDKGIPGRLIFADAVKWKKVS